MPKYPSTSLVTLADKLAKIDDVQVRKDIETEIRKADLDLLAKINEIFQQIGGGPFVPLLPNPLIAGEPSLGTPHPVSDANRTATLVVNTSTNTAGVWSAAVTMTGAPVGTKAAWCLCTIVKAGAGVQLAVEAASGYTLSDITSGTNFFKYWGMGEQNIAGETVVHVLKIHLDSNGQFKWCSSQTNATVQIGSALDYEM